MFQMSLGLRTEKSQKMNAFNQPNRHCLLGCVHLLAFLCSQTEGHLLGSDHQPEPVVQSPKKQIRLLFSEVRLGFVCQCFAGLTGTFCGKHFRQLPFTGLQRCNIWLTAQAVASSTIKRNAYIFYQTEATFNISHK